jgi:hypothetical protein
MNPKVETLGARLMANYIKVGFNLATTSFLGDEEVISSIPKQVQ